MSTAKSPKAFNISKMLIWQAYQQVRANKGASGIDEESIADFERNLKDNLYRIWNRISSGSYFPPAVKAVPIPKKYGGSRILGIPTVSDRIAQAAAKLVLEPILETIFDKDSYGYRPNKSAHDAIAITRQRCWVNDFVVEFDIKGLFDNIDHKLLMKALTKHCKSKWILLYVERWLKAPMQEQNDNIIMRDIGTPQGGVISPVLANLFLHYAFDVWVRKEMPHIPFCRYADDGLLHCRNKYQAEHVLKKITERFKECGLEIHPDKSGIVYCKDKNRKREFGRVSFNFLGYQFKPRRCVNTSGLIHPNFLLGISKESKKAIIKEIRSWHIQLKTDKSADELSAMFEAKLRGWYNYYGKFYPSAMRTIWDNLNRYLVHWVRRKHKRFRFRKRRAWNYLNHLAHANPNLFTHWKLGITPGAKMAGAV